MSRGKRKAEYEKIFNEIFGTSIKWSKLTEEELVQLATILANPDLICKKICKECGAETKYINLLKTFKDVLKDVPYEGPIIKVLKRMFGIETEEEKIESSRA